MFNYNNQVTLSQQQQIRDALARNLKIQAQSAQTKEAAAKATRPKLPRFYTEADIDQASVQERMQANGPMLDLGGIKQNANKHQDQSMRPHFDPAPTFPVDGKVEGTNPNMPATPATPEQSMWQKIMAYKPEGHESRLFQAAGAAIGDPLYGTTGKTIGSAYNELGPEYHNKDTLNEAKKRAGEIKAAEEEAKVGRQTSQLEQARQALERRAITPEQFTRMKTQIEGGADLKNVFDAMPDGKGKGAGGITMANKRQRYTTAVKSAKILREMEENPDFNAGGYFTPLAQDPTMKKFMNMGKDLLVSMGYVKAGTAMEDINKYQRESGAWLTQILRDDSGAAVPESEHSRYLSNYIPSLGEGKAEVAGKADLRDRVTASLGAVIGMTDEQQRNVIDEGIWQRLRAANPQRSRAELFDLAVRLSILKQAKEGNVIGNPRGQSGDKSNKNITVKTFDKNGNEITGKQ